MTIRGRVSTDHAPATVFVNPGHPTTVRNRVRGRSGPLVRSGAGEAPPVLAAAPLVIVRVRDRAAVREWPAPAQAASSGRVPAHLT